jgi:hypothetical protein
MMDIVKETQQILGSGEGELYKVLPAYVQKLIQTEAWVGRKKRDGSEFTSFEDFVTTKLWHGLESTIGDLKLYCKRDPDVVKMIDGAVGVIGEHGGKREQGCNTNLKQSNTATYALKRLKRDHPELAEQVINGDLSANAAAIQAGFRTWQFSMPGNITPEKAATKIRDKFGDAFANDLKEAL